MRYFDPFNGILMIKILKTLGKSLKSRRIPYKIRIVKGNMRKLRTKIFILSEKRCNNIPVPNIKILDKQKCQISIPDRYKSNFIQLNDFLPQ